MGLRASPAGRPERVSVAASKPITWVALLRAVNVGGNNKLPMKDFATMLESLGYRHVRTYIQSGNAVFQAKERSADAVGAEIEKKIASRFGLRVPVVIREGGELAKLLKQNPFLSPSADPKSLHVGFLKGAPTPGAQLDPTRSPGDEGKLKGRALFLRFGSGVGKSKLTMDYLDRTFGTTITLRNWNSVNALAALAAEVEATA